MPNLVHTIRGPIDRSRLEMREHFEDAPDHFVYAIEWLLDGEIVKRSCEVTIKEGHGIAAAAAELS